MSSQDRQDAESANHDGIVSLVEVDGGLCLGLSGGSDSVDLILTLDQARRAGIYMLDYAQEHHKPSGLVAMKGLWLFMAVGLAAAACFAACTILTLSDCRVRRRAGYMPQASDGMKTLKEEA